MFKEEGGGGGRGGGGGFCGAGEGRDIHEDVIFTSETRGRLSGG